MTRTSRAPELARRRADGRYLHRERENRWRARGYRNPDGTPFTHADYDAHLAAQGGACALCRAPEAVRQRGRVIALAVDTCPDTRAVRGLLCNRCNRALGMVDALGLGRVLEYLR